jgi:chorismate dehydratase
MPVDKEAKSRQREPLFAANVRTYNQGSFEDARDACVHRGKIMSIGDEIVRVGAVNYLNTKPLVYGLAGLAPQAKVVFDLPSRLADQLAAGQLDVALIPSIELFQDSSYYVISDACIGCRGAVLSVKLFSRVPMGKITKLALDEGSRTSVALVQILLEQQFGVRPELQALPIGAGLADTDADAVVLIGDRAIHSPPGEFAAVWDLGDQWVRWTGLPFVFAMWTARPNVDLGDLDVALASARDQGVENLEAIAAIESAPLGLTQPQCLSYLRDNLNFRFGLQEQQGLELFHRQAVRLGLAPEGFDLKIGSIAQG